MNKTLKNCFKKRKKRKISNQLLTNKTNNLTIRIITKIISKTILNSNKTSNTNSKTIITIIRMRTIIMTTTKTTLIKIIPTNNKTTLNNRTHLRTLKLIATLSLER